MLPQIEKLLTLQEKDQRLHALTAELKAIPIERQALTRQLATAQTKMESAKARLREIEVERKKLEVDAQAKRDLIARYKQQQMQTRKNEEYAALGHEIETAEKAIVGIEDQEIELMEEMEELKPTVKHAEDSFVAEKKSIAEKEEVASAREKALQERIATLNEERAAAAQPVDEDLLQRYERILKSKGDRAVVALEHGVCTGCHVKANAQTIIEVKSAKTLVSCPYCGRLLFFGE